ncbi:MAG: right-handed parallel beta-helix repeat-containing protein [Candidatus Krumholzibacteria bacterium]|jgi:hypothetical protein|nr:right-handed parallel beta-helix repeat-containing protein [Candidatus Krumholzibacteria bacterium]MDY0110306.1 right-handed parallel beta-helix repeat-containing protein [Candidatus Krumholzibacteria bacterium]
MRFTKLNGLALAPLLGLLLCAAAAEARTWHVEKDGSGDFTVIQDAVEAAAAGDTIRIGPGRFYEGRIWSFPSGLSEFIRVVILQSDLTLIGAGADETFIGQAEPYEVPQGDHKGIYASSGLGASHLVVEHLGFENAREGIATWETELVVNHCAFIKCDIAIFYLNHPTSGLFVADSLFDDLARDTMFIYTNWTAQARIERCTFVIGPTTWQTMHASFNNTAQALISDCTFTGGTFGAQVDQHSHCEFTRCVFDQQSIYGLVTALAGSTTVVSQSVFRNQGVANLIIEPSCVLHVTNCVYENVSNASIVIERAADVTVNNSDLARGAQYAVKALYREPGQAPLTFDFTDNYWGTDDPDEIAAMIYDASDHDDTNYTIDFVPFRSASTPVERRSLSEIKTLFR